MRNYILKYLQKVFVGLLIAVLLFLSACSSTRFVPDDDYLLSNVRIRNKGADISKEQLRPYIRQHENTKILGFWKFYLGLYNLSGRDDEKGINKWLRSIGEEPVVFDSFLVAQSSQQMSLFLQNKGYFQPSVSDTIIYSGKKKAKVVYTIAPGPRYYLKDLGYGIEDDSVYGEIMADTTKTLLKDGRPFTLEIHEQERERITENLRSKGFYNFSEEYIYYLSDTTVGEHQVKDSLMVMTPEDVTGLKHHRRFRIRDVLFHVGIGTDNLLEEDSGSLASEFDTLRYSGAYIIYEEELSFKPQLLTNSSYIHSGDLYNSRLVSRTHQLLSGLRLFKYINIRFRETGEINDSGQPLLDCVIRLSPGKDQSFSIDIEGTNSSGNMGAAGNFTYQHKNLLRGGEFFTLNTRLARQNQFVRSSTEEFNTLELGAEASIVVPIFWIPLSIKEFRQRYNPKTNISLAYNFQRRPDYTRTIANARMGYNWRSSRYISHAFYPVEFNFVSIPEISSQFRDQISDTFLKFTYEDHLIVNMNYSFLFNQQTLGTNSDFWYLRANVESAGNLLSLASPLWDNNTDKDYDELLGIRYAQYLKSDVDLRYHNRLDNYTSLVWRLFAGVGLPYGNLDVLPFEKRYFSGGANSIRAWPVRGLGPGSYSDEGFGFYNQTADIKLEFNLEYRFKLFWILEGALFLDVGNIWSIKESSSPEGGLFKPDRFYEELAVGTGVGTRFDFKYFIFRFDMGLKTHDPSLPKDERWIPVNRPWTWEDVGFNFAIGYPF
ncbi:translocation and assembly module lipoprotein TamL [Marinilabilia rubra]|uniref:translocation and assembly module lipoprotein TamL n=1 Tax=Marinilabilia rubra TaxID=2162893 RepID=UPI001E37F514|nr:BamA/TamA family outer membrane protein [Marinilabilia rubra]